MRQGGIRMMAMITAVMHITAGIATIPVRQCRRQAVAGIITAVINEIKQRGTRHIAGRMYTAVFLSSGMSDAHEFPSCVAVHEGYF